jgi:Mg2+/Co2+ transporter CorB
VEPENQDGKTEEIMKKPLPTPPPIPSMKYLSGADRVKSYLLLFLNINIILLAVMLTLLAISFLSNGEYSSAIAPIILITLFFFIFRKINKKRKSYKTET